MAKKRHSDGPMPSTSNKNQNEEKKEDQEVQHDLENQVAELKASLESKDAEAKKLAEENSQLKKQIPEKGDQLKPINSTAADMTAQMRSAANTQIRFDQKESEKRVDAALDYYWLSQNPGEYVYEVEWRIQRALEDGNDEIDGLDYVNSDDQWNKVQFASDTLIDGPNDNSDAIGAIWKSRRPVSKQIFGSEVQEFNGKYEYRNGKRLGKNKMRSEGKVPKPFRIATRKKEDLGKVMSNYKNNDNFGQSTRTTSRELETV